MEAPASAAAAGARVPPLGYRILAGAGRLVLLLVVLVALPAAVLASLEARGIALPVSMTTIVLGGSAVSALSTARYVLRPTRAYGPVSVATSLVTIGYLFALAADGTYRFAAGTTGGSVSVGYASLLEVLMVVPALALIAALLTTVEDAVAPGERLPFDYPP